MKKDLKLKDFLQGFRIRIRINLSCWIRIHIQIVDPDHFLPFWIRIRIRNLNVDPDPGEQKMSHKNRKKSRIAMFLSTGCSFLRPEGFSCSLGVLYGGLGISKLQLLIKKI
jgi:hypothetical protein